MPKTKETGEQEKKVNEISESKEENSEKSEEKEEEKKAEKKEKQAKKSEEKIQSVKDKNDETILAPLEDYIKTAAYLGTKVITPTMRKYVYRRRMDGLAILNTLIVDKKLKEGIDFIKQYKPQDWIVVCKREAGWRAAKMFSELTGVRVFTKKYPAGILTNPKLEDFFEPKMVFVSDPWLDKNALKDAKDMRIPVIGICDTNNNTSNIDVVMIGNNKSNKSLGLFFWLMSREYLKEHNPDKLKDLPELEEFAGEELVLEEPKKKQKEKERKERERKSEEEKIEEKMKALAKRADSEVRDGKEEKVVKMGGGAQEGV